MGPASQTQFDLASAEHVLCENGNQTGNAETGRDVLVLVRNLCIWRVILRMRHHPSSQHFVKRR
jgi:hypothetical protein